MRKVTSSLLAGVAALHLAASPAAAQDKVRVFKPADQWSADFGDDYCRLSRNFTDGSDTIALAFERIEPGNGVRLALAGNAVRLFRGAEELGWSFLPNDAERKSRYVRTTNGRGDQYLNLGTTTLAPPPPFPPAGGPAPTATLPPPAPSDGPRVPFAPPLYDREAEQAVAKGVTGISLSGGLVAPIEIQTGQLEAPMMVLQACADDLVQSWGVDSEKNKTGVRPFAEGMGAGWLPEGTVPFTDFARLAGGSNMIRLMVDAEGKARGCAVHWATLDKGTNVKICNALMKNAKFTPAKDADGNPMVSYWIGNPMFLGPPFPGARR